MFGEDYERFKTCRELFKLLLLLSPLALLIALCFPFLTVSFMLFLAVWVEQGDEISIEYSGTHALKRDLVK